MEENGGGARRRRGGSRSVEKVGVAGDVPKDAKDQMLMRMDEIGENY